MSQQNEELNLRLTNKCDFKIELEASHEAGHYLKIKYSWISVDRETM